MKPGLYCIGIALTLIPWRISSQTADSVPGNLPVENEYIVEELAGHYDDDLDASDVVAVRDLSVHNRVDLNHADPFMLAENLQLSPEQIQNLEDYKRKYGPWLTIYELNAIPGFDGSTIVQILPRICVLPNDQKIVLNPLLLLKQTRGNLMVRYGRMLETQNGFIPSQDTTTRGEKYLGDPSRVLIRFTAKAGNLINVGFVAEKDAGEQLFRGTQKQGFDHQAGCLMITPGKKLQSLIIGDYQLGFGQGLTLNSSGMMSSTRGLYQPYKFSNPARPHTSSNESSGLRGVAATMKTGKVGWVVFCSYKKLDARLNMGDTLNPTDGTEALVTTGYHRTPNEFSNRNRVQNLLYGGHITFRNHFIQVGITGFRNQYHPAFITPEALYKRFADPGGKMTVVGLDFRLLLPHVMIFGEATCRIGQSAGMIAGMLWYAHPRFKHTLVYGHYPTRFYNPLSSSYGRHQPNSNESILSWSFESLISKTLSCNGGATMVWFPWISYRLNKPSTGAEFYLSSTWKLSSRGQGQLRLVYKTNAQNATDALPVMKPVQELTSFLFSAGFHYSAGSSLTLKNLFYMNLPGTDGATGKPGYLLAADLIYAPVNRPFEIAVRYAVFDIGSYRNRIYAYERDVLYAFSAPAYYSAGERINLMIRYAFSDWLDLWVRYARTMYRDQSVTGSGLDETQTSHRSDIKIQVRYRF